jgi:hypothetical protein
VVLARGLSSLPQSLNPLRCTGAPLPGNLLLAAKLMVGGLLVLGCARKIPEPFLPLLPSFESFPWPEVFRRTLQIAFCLSALGITFNRSVRVSCFVAGLVFLIGPLSARATYTNGKFFCACMLIFIGLYHLRHSVWLLRAQLVIMYFGSGLNKLLIADWRSGQFMDHWLGTLWKSDVYLTAAPWLPPLMLGALLGWGTILTELGLVVGLSVPRLYRRAIWAAVFLRASSVLLSGYDFQHLLQRGAGLVPCVRGLARPRIRHYSPCRRLHTFWKRISDRIHFDGLFTWQPASPTTARLELGGKTYVGLAALNVWLLLNPAFSAMVALLLVLPGQEHRWIREWASALAISCSFPSPAGCGRR